jgi:hypothetical protein
MPLSTLICGLIKENFRLLFNNRGRIFIPFENNDGRITELYRLCKTIELSTDQIIKLNADSRCNTCIIIEVILVLPWLPATTTRFLSLLTSYTYSGNEKIGIPNFCASKQFWIISTSVHAQNNCIKVFCYFFRKPTIGLGQYTCRCKICLSQGH